MWRAIRRSSIVALILLLVAGCAPGASLAEYFAEVEALTSALEDELDEVEATVNQALLEIDFEAADAEDELVELFRSSIADTVDSFTGLVAGLGGLDPPSEVAARHREAVAAGERVLAEYRDSADQLAAISTISDIDAYAAQLSDSEVRGRFRESCRELQAIADREDVAADLMCS